MSILQPAIGPTDHVTGATQPVVSIVEYGDYQCPYCGEAFAMVKDLLARHGDRVQLAFRNFPLSNVHPQAINAAAVAEFAGEHGKFWQAHDLLYEHQARLGTQLYAQIIAVLGLSVQEAEHALDSQRLLPTIQSQLDSGLRSGVSGTPTFFINGTRFDSAQGWAGLADAVEALLAT